MTQDERIRLSSTDSVNSVDKDNFVDVEFRQHTKVFPFTSITDTVDQMEVFEKERGESTKYRLIVTINPYCSNILFNAVTEIVQNEGSDKLIIVTDEGPINSKGETIEINEKTINGYTPINTIKCPTNTDMIRNTEYSNGNDGFVYHCGFDIFNNHVLRNQSFKLVNHIDKDEEKEYKDKYNTIEDTMRYSDGSIVTFSKRTNIRTITEDNKRHLYGAEDILSVTDSINLNISEENGWFGFNNRSSIPTTEHLGKGKWQDLFVSKVFNGDNYPSCGFVEMYPDSTLYSFNPKYNPHKHREEQNWDVCLTYPYAHEKDGLPLVMDGGVNGLLIASYKQTYGTSNQEIVMFRSYVKHNLKKDDKFKLFFIENNKGKEFNEIKNVLFTVTNTGDSKDENREYYFYTNEIALLRDALKNYEDEKKSDEDKDKTDENVVETEENAKIDPDKYSFRFVKVVGERDCEYYYRKFRKLPNFRYKREELTEEIIGDTEKFADYLEENAQKNGKTLNFNKEQYPLAFAKTIYGDDITQITFTDTIDLSVLVDNLGRPLTEVFLSVIKRNKGYKVWYNKQKSDTDLESIEYSHCFGEVTAGIDIHGEKNDIIDDVFARRKQLSDVNTITNGEDYGTPLDRDITDDTEEFYGDVVELDNYNMVETVLSDVYFRFNTLQRETIFDNTDETKLNCGSFKYDEIVSDDYDSEGFKCEHYSADDINQGISTTYRPEGYCYKAHYPIQFRAFGRMQQGSHMTLDIMSCRPRQAEGLFVEVVSRISTGLNSNDLLYLCSKKNPKIRYELTVNSVLSNVRFLINPMTKENDKNYYSIYNLVEMINDSENWELRVVNTDIPRYAYEYSDNVYLWREVLSVGDMDAINLREYPFANGHFYVDKEINFFLKRQDGFGQNTLYTSSLWPNDIFGNVTKSSNYIYNSGDNSIC